MGDSRDRHREVIVDTILNDLPSSSAFEAAFIRGATTRLFEEAYSLGRRSCWVEDNFSATRRYLEGALRNARNDPEVAALSVDLATLEDALVGLEKLQRALDRIAELRALLTDSGAEPVNAEERSKDRGLRDRSDLSMSRDRKMEEHLVESIGRIYLAQSRTVTASELSVFASVEEHEAASWLERLVERGVLAVSEFRGTGPGRVRTYSLA